MHKKAQTFSKIVKILVALALGGVLLYFVLSAREAGGSVTGAANLLGDTDSDGQQDIRDPCPCTADNVKRQYQGQEYCVATQSQTEFKGYLDTFRESEDVREDMSQGLLLLDEANQSIDQEITLYTAGFCRKAILNTGWPNR